MSGLYPIPLGIAAYLGFSGYRKGSLSLDGAIAASLVGYASLANPFAGFGLALITFYLNGSKATKYKASVKERLETHSPSVSVPEVKKGKRDTSSGNRSAVQVLCNSATAVAACVAFRLLNTAQPVDPLSATVLKVVRVAGFKVDVTNLVLFLIVTGHYAACMGDTLASELGILSQSQPRLVTNPLRKVPKGTNGGISLLGLVFSALGGTLIGANTSACLLIHRHFHSIPSSLSFNVHLKLIALLTASGLVGSLIDSLLGATLQQTLYNHSSEKVLVGQITDVLDGKKQDDPNAKWEVVTGYNVLDNNAVNFLASATTALLTAWIGCRLF